MKPVDIPDCSYRCGSHLDTCHCKHPDIAIGRPKSVPWSKCVSCDFATTDIALAKSSKTCIHLGKVIHKEPCSCGAATKISIHKCELHKRCVPELVQLKRIKDKDVRLSLKCCETCSDRE